MEAYGEAVSVWKVRQLYNHTMSCSCCSMECK